MAARERTIILFRGAGDIATGCILRLSAAGFLVAALEIERPTAIRRGVALSECMYEGEAVVEGVAARRVEDPESLIAAAGPGIVPVLADPSCASLSAIAPLALVDAILAKRNLGTRIDMAPIVVALGPGFRAGVDAHAVVETNRGHDLGRVILAGEAEPDTGTPGLIGGFGAERVVKSPNAGEVWPLRSIGDVVAEGEPLLAIDGPEGRVVVGSMDSGRSPRHDPPRNHRSRRIQDRRRRSESGARPLRQRVRQGARGRRRRARSRHAIRRQAAMIYLDNAATSFPKAPGVPEAAAAQLACMGGNAGRTGGPTALAADRLLFEARLALARLFGLGGSGGAGVVFTKNATESLNLVMLGSTGRGDAVAVSSLEHNAVMRPVRWLERERGARAIVVPFDGAGRPDAAGLKAAVDAKPALAVFTMASNVTGAVAPWQEIAQRFKAAGSVVCLDASQAAGHFPIDFSGCGADFACLPGHKGLLGPTGTGILLALGEAADGARRAPLPLPLIRGGTGSHSESEEQPGDLPDRFEAGTQNLCGIAGLLAAVGWLEKEGLDVVRGRESALANRLLEAFSAIPGLRVLGPPSGPGRLPVVSVDAPGADLGAIAADLDRRGVAVRTGLHCAPAAHRTIGTIGSGGTLRFSPGYFTAEDEIDEAAAALADIMVEAR